jgi:hypothetical protein
MSEIVPDTGRQQQIVQQPIVKTGTILPPPIRRQKVDEYDSLFRFLSALASF